MTDTDPALADLARRYRFNTKTAAVITAALGPDDWALRPPAGGNSPHWILGHVVTTRRALRRMLGEQLEPAPWEAGFSRGATPGAGTTGGEAGYPTPADLLADLEASDERLGPALAGLDAPARAREVGRSFPDGSTTVGGAVHFPRTSTRSTTWASWAS
jgi:hypothetical protein